MCSTSCSTERPAVLSFTFGLVDPEPLRERGIAVWGRRRRRRRPTRSRRPASTRSSRRARRPAAIAAPSSARSRTGSCRWTSCCRSIDVAVPVVAAGGIVDAATCGAYARSAPRRCRSGRRFSSRMSARRSARASRCAAHVRHGRYACLHGDDTCARRETPVLDELMHAGPPLPFRSSAPCRQSAGRSSWAGRARSRARADGRRARRRARARFRLRRADTARRGPARKPASTRSGMTIVSVTGSPSKRSTARRFAPPRFTCATSAASADAQPFLVGLAKRDKRAAAALDEEHGLAAKQDDVRTGDTRGATVRALRPRDCSAVRLRRVGGCEHERLRLVAVARTKLAQPLDRAAERELRAAEPFDEVAATAGAERLERAQLGVHRAVAAGNALTAHAVARDDALTLEQELGERAAVRLTREQPVARATTVPASPSVAARVCVRSGERGAPVESSDIGARRATAATRRSSPRRPRRDPRAPGARPPRRAASRQRGRSRTARRLRARRGSRRARAPPAPARPKAARAPARPRGRRRRRGRVRRRPRSSSPEAHSWSSCSAR